MQVVEVVPIVRGITKETLTYFAKDYFEPGSFVLIPVRNSTQLGIVISSKDARLSRSEIRQRSFPLKKLARVNHSGRLSKGFIQAAKHTADFYACSLGSML